MLADESTCLRAYLGYSGWSAGQLETELAERHLDRRHPPADLFERPMQERLWRGLLSDEGDEWRLLADEPDEPDKN